MMDKRVIITFFTFLFLLGASVAAIAYTKGYRPNFTKTGPSLSATGLLVATSSPDGAQIFIDGRLTSATNDTISLPEGDYGVKIIKEGYISWEKKLKVKKEIVTEAQARLFPIAPDLRAETSTGALLPTLSPDGSKLVYGVASSSAEKRGVWVMDLTERPLLAQAQTRQIARGLAEARFTWSPDSKQVLASASSSLGFLLEADRLNSNPLEVSSSDLLESWEKEIKSRESSRLISLKPTLIRELEKMKILAWSPDESKILYTATISATLPPILEKPLLGASTQPEQREIKRSSTYVYDLKEDKNFFIMEKSPETQPLRWFPDSRHLIWVEEKSISLAEYDGTNKNTIYTGPFENSFVYPWPSGNKLIIQTTYNRPSGATANLYSIILK